MITDANVYPMIPVTDMGGARDFYGGVLGFSAQMGTGDEATQYAARGGATFLVYLTNGPTDGEHPVMGFLVDDIVAEVGALKGKSIAFEEYDMEIPGVGRIKTENSIASAGPVRNAWFKDPEGNLLSITQLVGAPA